MIFIESQYEIKSAPSVGIVIISYRRIIISGSYFVCLSLINLLVCLKFYTGIFGELPDPRPDAAVRARALVRAPVDTRQRGVRKQRPERRHCLPAQVSRL